jgi:RNA polymerase sigma factor (sigma-70 family)
VRDVGTRTGADDVLVARLRAGDDRALGTVYDLYASMVHGIARRVCVDDHRAREVTQDVFTYLWERPDRVDLARGTIRAYLAVVAHRRAVDEVRRSVRRANADSRAATAVRTEQDQREGHEDQVVDDLADRQRDARLHGLLDQLPADQRAAVELAYFRGHSYREVAVILGIPEGTAKSRLRLALGRLRTLVATETPEAITP